MKKTINWGIVGPGNIANKFAKALKNVDGAELVAVASRSEKSGSEFAKKYNIPQVFVGYEELAKAEGIDAVYIATPHPFHKPCAEIFLNAKKHVLCEKPVCINAKQAVELYECAKENGVFLMEAMWTRFLPAINEAKKIVQSGEIGEIRGIQADFCYFCTPDEDPKLFSNDTAGGSLLDVGIYGLNFAAIFLGSSPETITSVADINSGVDCQTNVLMKYKSGAIASVSSAINTQKPENGYIFGTNGYITLPRFYGVQEIIVNSGDGERVISKPSIGDGFEEEIYEACDCIRCGKTQSDVMPMEESIIILEQMDYIREQINLKYSMLE
ncbi:MAG: Gfo/Idh/MocA family oxidoreductase [Ruminococcaceae bacterium]|nr:Gfo/Idh/MocA family oxidoreductase [Oscillospiraceae bacterium]